MLEKFVTDMHVGLSAGNPPIYVQLALATMVYILLRLYVMVRNGGMRSENVLNWLTGVYVALLLVLSFGTWDYIMSFYKTYGRQAVYALSRYI